MLEERASGTAPCLLNIHEPACTLPYPRTEIWGKLHDLTLLKKTNPEVTHALTLKQRSSTDVTSPPFPQKSSISSMTFLKPGRKDQACQPTPTRPGRPGFHPEDGRRHLRSDSAPEVWVSGWPAASSRSRSGRPVCSEGSQSQGGVTRTVTQHVADRDLFRAQHPIRSFQCKSEGRQSHAHNEKLKSKKGTRLRNS